MTPPTAPIAHNFRNYMRALPSVIGRPEVDQAVVSRLTQRAMGGLFLFGVVLPVICGISGALIGMSRGFVEADRRGANKKETMQEMMDGAADEALRRVAIGSRILTFAALMPEFMGWLSGWAGYSPAPGETFGGLLKVVDMSKKAAGA